METLLEALYLIAQVLPWKDTGDRPWHSSGWNVAMVGCALTVIAFGAFLVLFALLNN